MKMKPQAAAVLELLELNGSLTPRQAMNMKPPCYRLASRVCELRHKFGHAIRTKREPHKGGRHARYILDQPGLGL